MICISLSPDAATFFPMNRVLIAEDNDINVLLLQRFLKKWNIGSDRAADGQEVLKLITTTAYAAILMDIQMPVLDGFETAAILRKQGYDLPIIALTADASSPVTGRLCQPLFNDYIIKPISSGELRQKMEALLQM